MGTVYSQGELDLQTTAAGQTNTTVILASLGPDHYPAVLHASLENDNADYVDIGWRDPNGVFYRLKRVATGATWESGAIRQVPPVPGTDLVAIISDAAAASTGRVMCDGEDVRDTL